MVVCLLFFINCFGQNTDMLETDEHKYLTFEAWELVKQVHPEVIYSPMNSRVGSASEWNTGNINGEKPWQVGKIITGAYREDEEDVIYGYNGIHWPWNNEGPYITATHFWDADDPNLDSRFYPSFTTQGFENAFVKMTAYWNGRKANGEPFIILGPYWWYDIPFYIKVALLDNDGTSTYAGTPTTLDEAYKDKRKFKVIAWTDLFTEQWVSEPKPYMSLADYMATEVNVPHPYSLAESNALADRVTWEIVGRMCHLLEDSGVPAHAHNNEHPSESYEKDYMPDHFLEWNHTHAMSQAQQFNQAPLFNLINTNNPILYSLYMTNQIADRFASNGCLTFNCPVVLGDNNYNVYTPSVPGQNSDFVGGILGAIYNKINFEGIPVNPGVFNDYYLHKVADYSYVFSMRATASFLYYIYQKFNIQSNMPPVIYNVVSSTPDNCVYRGETIRLYCHSNNAPNTTYTWEYVPCSNNQCHANIQGITFTPQGNTLAISNSNYQSLTCDNCTLVDWIPTALYYKIKVTASAPNCPSVTYEYLAPQRGIVPVAAGRPGGCPYVYVQNDSGKFIAENNILHRSEFTQNIGLDISDKYLLNVKPGVLDNKISMNLFESTHDISSINSIKLLAVDHPQGTKIGVTENNDIVMYYDADAESPKNASKNHIENITNLVQYNTGNGNKHDTVSGISADDIINEFDEPLLRNKLLSARNKFKSIRNGSLRGSSDSTALIMRIGYNTSVDRVPFVPITKQDAGYFTGVTADAVNVNIPFARRELPSDVIIPFGYNTSIDKANIEWNRDYNLYYAMVVDVFYEGFDVTELPLSEALNSANQNLLEDLQNVDGYFATLDTTGIIMLKFNNVENINGTPGTVRDYVLVTDGQYAAGTVPQRRGSNIGGLKNNTSDNVLGFTNKLNANFPNPFNPVTKINYQIKRDGFVSLKIYNVIGQLVKELVGEFKNAGNYMVDFNGSHLASGTYYYRIESNDFIETKKMILIK
jgi:hypothetical protein